MLIDIIKQHKKVSIFLSIVILIMFISGLTVIDLNNNSNHTKDTETMTTEELNKSGGYDKGNTAANTEQNKLVVTNYTVMDELMSTSVRNAVINAVHRSLIYNESTINGYPSDSINHNIPDNTTNSELYPPITDRGGYFEATIDDDKVTNTGKSWDSELTMTTTTGKKIYIHVNCDPGEMREYAQIEVRLLN